VTRRMLSSRSSAKYQYTGELDHEDRMSCSKCGGPAQPLAVAEPFGLVMIEALVCGTPSSRLGRFGT
jgi:hypothetical protein